MKYSKTDAEIPINSYLLKPNKVILLIVSDGTAPLLLNTTGTTLASHR
jgi:hypothetical protein